ncbi:MAG: threonylcarbamoyl-AMP synthase [Peptococcaceae bacterium]|jgi:L-threonylcarbamoyladenylate synthase|nr:threonylcarbamoyl-AMP synthase [Peptococcaceae bacterium]
MLAADGARQKKTRLWRILAPEDPRVEEAGRVLRDGGLVAFPTETVYGLGANGLDEKAVAGIYAAKGRPADNPLILHVISLAAAKALTRHWDSRAQKAAEKFWPGPLTMVLPAAPRIPSIVTAGLDTVAIRVPADPVAQALIGAAGVPVAAPSANLSGRPSPTRALHVLEDMDGRIDVILDGGPCAVGLESTILDLSVTPPAVLRPGAVTLRELRRLLGPVGGEADEATVGPGPGAASSAAPPKAPGMKYRHYAPLAPATLLLGEPAAIAAAAARLLASPPGSLPKTAFLLSQETWLLLGDAASATAKKAGHYCLRLGRRDRPAEMAALLYEALRACDRAGAAQIFIEGCNPRGRGVAVLNRLRKAVGGKIWHL